MLRILLDTLRALVGAVLDAVEAVVEGVRKAFDAASGD